METGAVGNRGDRAQNLVGADHRRARARAVILLRPMAGRNAEEWMNDHVIVIRSLVLVSRGSGLGLCRQKILGHCYTDMQLIPLELIHWEHDLFVHSVAVFISIHSQFHRDSEWDNLSLISTVDGEWSAWVEWSICTTSCGLGIQRRFRSCSNPRPAYGGRECNGSRIETRNCNSGSCPGNKDEKIFLSIYVIMFVKSLSNLRCIAKSKLSESIQTDFG